MRIVKCYDCGKKYDFDADDFCPGCGAFTPPPRKTRIDLDGNVVRVDGINERNHAGSFVHAELHAENRKRRGSVLEKAAERPRSVHPQSFGKRLPSPSVRSFTKGLDLLGDAAKLFSDLLDS